MERKLYNLGIPLSGLQFLGVLGALTLLSGALLYVLKPEYTPLVLLIPFAALFTLEYLHGRKVAAVREELPRFIHFLSTHPGLTLRDVIRLGSDGFGELSREMKGIAGLVEKGVNPARALKGLARRLGDEEVGRIIEGLLAAFRGGNVAEYLKNLSEELYFTHELENERRGTLSLQRYSIAFSSTVLVPFILGIVVSMVERLTASLPPVTGLILPYLILLSLISGSFLAFTEGKPKNAPFYILLGSAVALATYWVVSWLY